MSSTDRIPVGYCHCGCGAKTSVATKNNTSQGYVIGQPRRYLNGHANRRTLDSYTVEDCGYITPCWIWQLGTCANGYGRVKREGRMQQAHRVFYANRYGCLPSDLDIHHKCEVRSCVNPEHLEPMTTLDHLREHSNVTIEIARAVRLRYRPRVITAPMLATEYGITPKQVRHIVAGHIWREKE